MDSSTKTATALVGGINKEWEAEQALTEKKWSDSSTDEKLEKIKLAIRSLENQNHWQGNSLNSLRNQVNKLEHHSHNEEGVVIPITLYTGGGPGETSLNRKSPLE